MSEKAEEILRDLEERIGIHESDSDKFHRDVKSYALQVAREAVEEEFKLLKDYADTLGEEASCSRILSRIESKLEES